MTIHKIEIFLILPIKKVIGKKIDEFRGKIIREFVGLRPKMYSLIAVDGEEVEKSKRSQ